MRIGAVRPLLHALWLSQVIGCASLRPPADLRGAGIRLPQRSAVIFFVDGVNHEVLDDLLARGELPSVHKWFVQRGVVVDQAVSSLPPITYAISTTMLTGMFPGHHGILGNRWFDRGTGALHDYGSARTYRAVNDDFTAPTIYEVLADQLSVNVQNHTRRGADVTMDHVVSSGIKWLTHRFSAVDHNVGRCMGDLRRAARRAGRWPTVVMTYFPGVDEVGHRDGPRSERYREAVRVADRAIGDVIEAYVAAGLADSTYFVLLSDHGMVENTALRSMNLVDWLRRHEGWRVLDTRRKPDRRRSPHPGMDRYDAVVINSAWRRAAIHLPGPCGWSCRPEPDELRRVASASLDGPDAGAGGLIGLDAVGLVCFPLREGVVRVLTKTGGATVERRRSPAGTQYRLLVDAEATRTAIDARTEPFGYLADPNLAAFIEAGWHGSREWLEATAATRYPDFVPQVVEMFDSPRAGDLVVFAAEGWSLAEGGRGGHGSCLDEDMIVPMYFTGPDLPRGGRVATARLADVMPTIIELLGFGDRLSSLPHLDGESIAAQLRSAVAPPDNMILSEVRGQAPHLFGCPTFSEVEGTNSVLIRHFRG